MHFPPRMKENKPRFDCYHYPPFCVKEIIIKRMYQINSCMDWLTVLPKSFIKKRLNSIGPCTEPRGTSHNTLFQDEPSESLNLSSSGTFESLLYHAIKKNIMRQSVLLRPRYTVSMACLESK